MDNRGGAGGVIGTEKLRALAVTSKDRSPLMPAGDGAVRWVS